MTSSDEGGRDINSAPNRMQDAVANRIAAMRKRASDVRDRLSTGLPDPGNVQDARQRTADFVRENPLGLLFGAVAVGFIIGSVLPATNLENDRLGPVGDRLRETARAAGGRMVEQGRSAVYETIATTTQSIFQSPGSTR